MSTIRNFSHRVIWSQKTRWFLHISVNHSDFKVISHLTHKCMESEMPLHRWDRVTVELDSPWPGWWSDPWRWTPAWSGTEAGSCAAAPVCPRGRRPVAPPLLSRCRSVAETACWRCWMLWWYSVIQRSWMEGNNNPSDRDDPMMSSGACRPAVTPQTDSRGGVSELLLRAVNVASHLGMTGAAFKCCWKFHRWSISQKPIRYYYSATRIESDKKRGHVWQLKKACELLFCRNISAGWKVETDQIFCAT